MNNCAMPIRIRQNNLCKSLAGFIFFLTVMLIATPPGLAQQELQTYQVGGLDAGSNGSSGGDQFGTSLVSAERDFDGDGYDDVYVGVPYAVVGGTPRVGRVELISGRTAQLLPVPPIEVSLPVNSLFGFALATLDIDGDGVEELAVGAPGPNAEKVYIFSLDSQGLVVGGGPVATIDGFGTIGAFGFSLAAGQLADADVATCQDATEELIVGAPGRDPAMMPYGNDDGQVFAFDFDMSSAPQQLFSIVYMDSRPGTRARAGYRVESYNDQANCLDEIVVGAPYSIGDRLGNFSLAGAAFAVDAQTVTTSMVTVERAQHDLGFPQVDPVRWFQTPDGGNPGQRSNSEFGSSLKIIPDISAPGGGEFDIVVGARKADGGGTLRRDLGSAWIIDGDGDATYQSAADLLGRYNGLAADDYLGTYAVSVDIDSDNFEDLVIGAAGFDGMLGANTGRLSIFPLDGSLSPPGLQPSASVSTSSGSESFFSKVFGLTISCHNMRGKGLPLICPIGHRRQTF